MKLWGINSIKDLNELTIVSLDCFFDEEDFIGVEEYILKIILLFFYKNIF